jgi:hypothetical protein
VLPHSLDVLTTAPRAAPTPDWGTVPAWVSAVGSCTAFLLAVWIYARGERDRRREQARLVTPLMRQGPRRIAGPTSTSFSSLRNDPESQLVIRTGGSHYDVRGDILVWHLVIMNRSEEAITSVEGEVHDAAGRAISAFRRLASLAPREDIEFTLVSPYSEHHHQSHGFRIRFTDAGGRRWKRSRTTPLRRSSR